MMRSMRNARERVCQSARVISSVTVPPQRFFGSIIVPIFLLSRHEQIVLAFFISRRLHRERTLPWDSVFGGKPPSSPSGSGSSRYPPCPSVCSRPDIVGPAPPPGSPSGGNWSSAGRSTCFLTERSSGPPIGGRGGVFRGAAGALRLHGGC